MQQPAIRPTIHERVNRPNHRHYVVIHHWFDDKAGKVVQGWGVRDMDKHLLYKSQMYAAVEDECARLNRADL